MKGECHDKIASLLTIFIIPDGLFQKPIKKIPGLAYQEYT